MNTIRHFFHLMECIIQKTISLNYQVTNHINSNVKTTLGITLLLLFIIIFLLNPHLNDYLLTLLYFSLIIALFYIITQTLNRVYFWLLDLIDEILEGFGGFNNTLIPNEELSESLRKESAERKLLRDQEEIRSWKERIKQENIENGIEKYISSNLKQICIISILFHIYLFINSELFPTLYFLMADNTADILSSATPFLLYFMR